MRICIDLDGTICENKKELETYNDVLPKPDVVKYLNYLKSNSHYIIIYTARNMITFSANIGKINAVQAPIIFDWLKKYNIPYDEIIFGKPHADVFIDDKAIKFTNWNDIKDTLKL